MRCCSQVSGPVFLDDARRWYRFSDEQDKLKMKVEQAEAAMTRLSQMPSAHAFSSCWQKKLLCWQMKRLWSSG